MLTAPMMYRGIDVNLPKAAAKPTAVEERMVLTVTKDRTLYLNDKRVAPGSLDTQLRGRVRKAAPTRRSTSRLTPAWPTERSSRRWTACAGRASSAWAW